MKFDFSKALSYLKSGKTISLTMNNVERSYNMKNGIVMCTPKGKKFLSYKIDSFYVDAIMSNDWELKEDETNKK